MMLKLVVRRIDGKSPPTEHEFDQDSVSFGRAFDNDLVIPDDESVVSSKHGRIDRKGTGWIVIDEDSSNGTWVNKRELTNGAQAPVHDGDIIVAGDFEIRVTIPAYGTIVRKSPGRSAEQLIEQLSVVYAECVRGSVEDRKRAVRKAIQSAVHPLSPAQKRAVLGRVSDAFSAGRETGSDEAKAGKDSGALGEREELYLAGYKILQGLAGRFLAGRKLATAQDAARFGRLLQQTLEETFEWISKSLLGRKKFEDEFSANVTMMFSLKGNPLKRGRSPEQVGEHLLDWDASKNISAIREDLEGAFRDLTLHQLGLLAGAQQAVTDVLSKLDPAKIEEAARAKSSLGKWLPGNLEWQSYEALYKNIMGDETRLYEELISPSLQKGYVAKHEEQHGTGGEESHAE